MRHWYQRPPSEISECIRTILVMEGSEPPAVDAVPLVTNVSQSLVCRIHFNNDGSQSISLNLHGKGLPEEQLNCDDRCEIILYFFKPFTMACVFGMDAKELAKGTVDLGDWSPQRMNAVRMQLSLAFTIVERVEVLNNFLIRIFEERKKEFEIIRATTDHLMCNPEKESLAFITKKLGMNERTFLRTFKKYVGVTPGQYRRICQFEDSFTQVKEGKFGKLTDVAYDNNYADQSHFIRAFKEFTEMTPNDYLKKGLGNKE